MPDACHLIAQNNIPDAQRIICKKHHIGSITYQKIIDNQRPPEPTEKWHKIIESVSIFDQISDNQESSHDTSFSTQEDRITHMKYLMDNENDANSNGLNTVTSRRKDKVSQKKKASIKPKDESSSVALMEKNENKDDTSRQESDLKKLTNITRESVVHLIFSP
ncbi:hypothetical protein RclHR1_01740005 [Rhizophagus clarus]|uniref:Uncharacterized protein n=1 Tax=Rhizophagus clarus TaxID=94130 RepID=A0A2Z6RD39_9GLOM|nr:hypothetical protein RclHR1_01740005 [Rhizophagus clarus]GET02774.1 hypothetical protein GLOIN_2v1488287 [Rhizophagus clarus]